MNIYAVLAVIGALAAVAEWWTRPFPGAHAGSQTVARSLRRRPVRPHPHRPVRAWPYPRGRVVTALIIVGGVWLPAAALLGPVVWAVAR